MQARVRCEDEDEEEEEEEAAAEEAEQAQEAANHPTRVNEKAESALCPSRNTAKSPSPIAYPFAPTKGGRDQRPKSNALFRLAQHEGIPHGNTHSCGRSSSQDKTLHLA